MARKQKAFEVVVELTRDEKIAKAFKSKISDYGIRGPVDDVLSIVPAPPEHARIKVGTLVEIGNLQNVEVVAVSDDYKLIVVEYTSTNNNYGNPIVTTGNIGCWCWFDAIPLTGVQDTKFIKRNLLGMDRYTSTHLSGLLNKALYFGTDANPDYQRGYVWSEEDEVRLIDSLFQGRDIGKFVFVKYPWPRNDDEVLDGKQRLNTLVRFITNQFKYKGLYWNQIGKFDRDQFENRIVQYVEIDGKDLTEADKLEIFLSVNAAGVPQSEDHLTAVRAKLATLKGE
jgi:hypothetical protein